MPGANLAAYLAKNYLIASNSRIASSERPPSSDFHDSSRPKKKRKKNADGSTPEPGGLIVADDDEDLSIHRKLRIRDGGEDDDIPTFDTGAKSAEFRKKKGGGAWTVVSAANDSATMAQRAEDTEGDRILAEAAEESRLRRQEIDNEDAPAIVDGVSTSDAAPRMQSGARSGLQTATDTAALIAREAQEKEVERQQASARKKSKHKSTTEEPEEETIYRDATGRRIDVSLKRAEARAAAEEKIRAEKKAKEDAMGTVQLREKQEKRQELEEAKLLTLGRGADDEVMNEELKGRARWDDPMAGYMAQRAAETSAVERKEKGAGRDSVAASRPRKKVYSGPPAAPNRYGILPGWRWDGVDRSNGFEKDWFQARSKKGRMEELSYQWQMDE